MSLVLCCTLQVELDALSILKDILLEGLRLLLLLLILHLEDGDRVAHGVSLLHLPWMEGRD